MPEPTGSLSFISNIITILTGMPLKVALLIFAVPLIINVIKWIAPKTKDWKLLRQKQLQIEQENRELNKRIGTLLDLLETYIRLAGDSGLDSFVGLLKENEPNDPLTKKLRESKHVEFLTALLNYGRNHNNPRIYMRDFFNGFSPIHYFITETWVGTNKASKEVRWLKQFEQKFNETTEKIETLLKEMPPLPIDPFANSENQSIQTVSFKYHSLNRI
jgi:hypothetical protein